MKGAYACIIVVIIFLRRISSYPVIQPPYPMQYLPGQAAPLYDPYGPASSNPVYDPSMRWPSVPYNSPRNYLMNGKENPDSWLLPQNMPRFYDQVDGTRLQGYGGYLMPMFYGRR